MFYQLSFLQKINIIKNSIRNHNFVQWQNSPCVKRRRGMEGWMKESWGDRDQVINTADGAQWKLCKPNGTSCRVLQCATPAERTRTEVTVYFYSVLCSRQTLIWLLWLLFLFTHCWQIWTICLPHRLSPSTGWLNLKRQIWDEMWQRSGRQTLIVGTQQLLRCKKNKSLFSSTQLIHTRVVLSGT